ncbi:uncharacterized protein LOC127874309 [Dreissena polymorpha]|uniref:Uncharacterized protein n=1 Tax=Dreissena polymorpha TaxID=45954 RepID=A0A9D4QZT1_DREPO|nr:uncharacterized protein LOC127874309 [Dreissena polymorpha]KAH3849659.1 hypothetical protein DPMN_092062 [Dreissena polymorpha]
MGVSCALNWGFVLIYALLISVLLCQSVSSLRCYSCFATGGKNRCEDYNTYKTAMSGKGDPEMKKNCTDPFDKICIIETFAVLGATVSHIRDCSNDANFSFSSNLQNIRGAYYRLYNLDPTKNETACEWDGQHLVCLTKCVSDFCNGPILAEVNKACAAQAITMITLMSFICFAFSWR